jgi:VanZ family protein
VVLTAVICLAFAVMDEWYQASVPGRIAALGDVAADAAGIALGIALREGLRPVVLAWKGDPQR